MTKVHPIGVCQLFFCQVPYNKGHQKWRVDDIMDIYEKMVDIL